MSTLGTGVYERRARWGACRREQGNRVFKLGDCCQVPKPPDFLIKKFIVKETIK